MQLPNRQTAATWLTDFTVYTAGKVLIETDTGVVRLADGVRAFFQLPIVYVGPDVLTPAAVSITSSATPTYNVETTEQLNLTAQAADITSMTSGQSGTPYDGQLLDVRIKGTAARAITWGAKFLASGTALLTTTATTKTHLSRFKYDTVAAAFVPYYVDTTGY